MEEGRNRNKNGRGMRSSIRKKNRRGIWTVRRMEEGKEQKEEWKRDRDRKKNRRGEGAERRMEEV